MDKRRFNLVSAILRGVWAVDPLFAIQHLPWAEDIINGNQKAFWDDQEQDDEPRLATLYVQDGGVWRQASDKDPVSLTGIQTLDISGPMMKNGGWCSYGTRDYVSALDASYQNKRVMGTVITWDTPGGQVDGTPSLYDAVSNPAKPTVSLVKDGMCCSAGVWGSVGSDAILASQLTDMIGSVGVYTSLRDAREMYKKYGINVTDVYSNRSTQKNIEYRRALEGDLAPLRTSLDKTADLFIATVKAARGKKLTSDEWNTGATFTAQEAKSIGLIDDMGTFEDALTLAADMAKTRTKKSFSPNQTTNPKANMSLVNKAKAFLIGASATDDTDTTPRDAALEALAQVAEDRAARITNLETEYATAQATITQLETAATANTATIADLQQQVTALTGERNTWKDKAETYGAQPGAVATRAKSDKTAEGEGDAESFQQKTAGLSQNKLAEEFGL